MTSTRLDVQQCTFRGWLGLGGWTNWFSWIKWNTYNEEMLRSAERVLLGLLKTPYRGHYVEIRGVVDSKDKIWTISLNEESKKTPIVLLHGFASGSALWCLNLDTLAANRPLHAIDLPGFARSSRPNFSPECKEAETQFLESIESWRREMRLDKMILLGHSFGGYLAAAYALEYPDRIKHLILADPWGFPPKPDETTAGRKLPIWAKPIIFVAQKFYPLSTLRATGPFGQWVIQRFRPDLIRHFEIHLKQDISMVPQYIHQCNIQNPTGEAAFKTMSSPYGWAKDPMINRIINLRADVPLTVIYGGRSWVDGSTGEDIKDRRPAKNPPNITIIVGAGHHLYAEKHEQFNRLVNEAAASSDEVASAGSD